MTSHHRTQEPQGHTVQPVRVQYRQGQKMPSPNGLPTVFVGHPSRFKNPFKFRSHEATERDDAVAMFERYIVERPGLLREARAKLRGKNLACRCPLDGKACHAEVLLCIANGPGGAE